MQHVSLKRITFQTEKAKLMSGTLTRMSSSSISTAKDQSKNQTNATEKNVATDKTLYIIYITQSIYNVQADRYTDHLYQSQGMVVVCCAFDC